MADQIKDKLKEADFTLANQYKGRDLAPQIDVQAYIAEIDTTGLAYPYVCPKCGRPFRSDIQLEAHLDSFDHDNPPEDYDPCDLDWKPKKRVDRLKEEFEKELRDSGSETSETPKPVVRTPSRTPGSHRRRGPTWGSRKRKANFRRGSDVSDTAPKSKTRVRVDEHGNITTENLTWAEAQRLVEFEDDQTNKIYRVSIFTDMELVNSDGSALPALARGSRVPMPETICDEVKTPKLPDREIPNDYIEYKFEAKESAIEYQMDEEDHVMLEHINGDRDERGLKGLSCEVFEMIMDGLEKDSMWDTNKPRTSTRDIDDEDVVCCVCNDGECTNTNAILFCDLCNLAVHQECYGVPYIPEGQWLCRRCQFSPSRAVDCVLCPSLHGAFKQTHDNRWCHIVCALWVPEVSFQNPVFLEPIDGFRNVPKARWNLKCYICKKTGACIQCNKNACYTAFHVTCAQQAGLYMEMKVQKTDGVNGINAGKVLQTAYCHGHTPKDWSPRPLKTSEKLPNNREAHFQAKVDEAREAIEGRSSSRMINKPYIPTDKLGRIRAILTDHVAKRTSPLFKELLTFWSQKRMVRNGVPLIRRLVSVQKGEKENHATEEDKKKLKEQLRVWQRLRHDLERARLLVEQIKKRERLKAQEIQKCRQLAMLKLNPWAFFLRDLLEKFRELDESRIFFNPVTDAIAPLYSKIITSPMDFLSIEYKIAKNCYSCFPAFEYDVNLILKNCMHYNGNSTIFYKIAKDIEVKIQPIQRDAKTISKKYNTVTGQHLKPGENFDAAAAEIKHNKFVAQDLKKQLSRVEQSPCSKHQKKTVTKLTSEVKIAQRRLRILGVSESEDEDQNSVEAVIYPDPEPDHLESNSSLSESSKENGHGNGSEEEISPKVEENGNLLENGITNGDESSNDKTDDDVRSDKKSTSSDLRNFQPLDTVWAKCKGYPWYPARIINPELADSDEPLLLGDEEIPTPSTEIVKLGSKLNTEGEPQHHLVLFFDQKRTWTWLPKNKIALLGKDLKFDSNKLRDGKTTAQKKSIQRAYKCARDPTSPE